MKKLLLSISLSLLLFFSFYPGNKLFAFDKKSLVERFQNTSCGPCASINNAWYNATTQGMVNSDAISHIVYNVWWPSPSDPMYLLNQADNTTRTNYYGCNAIPWIEVNATHISNNLGALNTAVANGNNEYAPFNIMISQGVISNNLIEVGIKIIRDPNDVTSFGNVKLRVAITEKTVSFPSPPGSNGEFEFYSVCRKMMPNAGGSIFAIPAPGDSVEVTLEYIPTTQFINAVNLDSLRIVAFIQDDNGQTVYQSASLDYSESPIEGLVGYYPFNKNADDESGNGNHGTVNGAELTFDRFGNDSSAYYFNGVEDHIEVGNSPELDLTERWTYSAWVKFDQDIIDEYYTIIGRGENSTEIHQEYVRYDGINDKFEHIYEYAVPGGYNSQTYNTYSDLNPWYFVVTTRDVSGNYKIFINGELAADSLCPIPTISLDASLFIGIGNNYVGGPYEFGFPFKGKIDDVRIYDYALSEIEIENLYHEAGWNLTKWQTELLVVDAGDGSQVITLGQDPAATDSLDIGLGESHLPPPPPPGGIDVRFNFPTNPPIQSLKDFRSDSLQAIDWEMTFQGNYPLDFCWNPNSLPFGTFYLVDGAGGLIVNVDMKTDSCVTVTNSAITKLYIKYGRQNYVSVGVNAGWNIVSPPVLKPNMQKDNYFPGNFSDAFTFYPDSGYVIRDSIELSRGYWLKFSNDTAYAFQGLNHRFRFDIENGWNMIGPFDFSVRVSSIETAPSGIITSNFYGYYAGYLIADTLKPGKGYWVKASADGKVILDPSILVKRGEDQFASLTDQWGKILVEDAVGNETTLYVTEDDISVELPPQPPIGIFDARFTTDNLVENISDESKRIKVSSASYPITISVEGLTLKINDIISGDIINEELHSGDKLVISDPNINILKISGDLTAGIPVSYELYQNYPNPFNPVTTIKFAIPKESKVNLRIYNILGEEVTSLIDKEMKPGYYEYKFDASNFSSGVYLYSIIADEFNQTKKMMLMK